MIEYKHVLGASKAAILAAAVVSGAAISAQQPPAVQATPQIRVFKADGNQMTEAEVSKLMGNCQVVPNASGRKGQKGELRCKSASGGPGGPMPGTPAGK